jgi:hypothetical protein
MDDRIVEMSERIAALEAQAEHGQTDRNEIKESLHTMELSLGALVKKISKWEGKFGGVIFIIGCLWAFLTGLPGAVVDWIKAFGAMK